MTAHSRLASGEDNTGDSFIVDYTHVPDGHTNNDIKEGNHCPAKDTSIAVRWPLELALELYLHLICTIHSTLCA